MVRLDDATLLARAERAETTAARQRDAGQDALTSASEYAARCFRDALARRHWDAIAVQLASHGVDATVALGPTRVALNVAGARSIAIETNGWRVEVNDSWTPSSIEWRGWTVHLIDPTGTIRDRTNPTTTPSGVVRAVLDALDIARSTR